MVMTSLRIVIRQRALHRDRRGWRQSCRRRSGKGRGCGGRVAIFVHYINRTERAKRMQTRSQCPRRSEAVGRTLVLRLDRWRGRAREISGRSRALPFLNNPMPWLAASWTPTPDTGVRGTRSKDPNTLPLVFFPLALPSVGRPPEVRICCRHSQRRPPRVSVCGRDDSNHRRGKRPEGSKRGGDSTLSNTTAYVSDHDHNPMHWSA